MGARRKAARKRKQPVTSAARLAVALRERKEAIEQQAATAEILKVISSSPRDRRPAFDAILKSALRLCDAHLGVLNLREADGLRTVAQRGGSAEFAAWVFERGVFKPDGGAVLKAVRAGKAFQVADALQGADYLARKPNITRFIDLGGVRTFLAVPLLKHGEVIGNIGIYRREVRPFTDRQIALVKTFADQAVIAIENARLFNETKSSLARQTSTAEILRVLGGSMTDAQPVFDAIVKNCRELFKGAGVVLRLASNGLLEVKASVGATPGPVPIDRTSIIGTCVVEGRTLHFPDLEEAAKKFPRIRQLGLKYGYRSGMYAPLTRGGKAIGAIGVLRREPGAFDDKDVQLLNTFADQAVIAIENVRLFNETREALERQTATAEILSVIARSPSDTQPVFEAIACSAQKLFGAHYANVTRLAGDELHLAAYAGTSVSGAESLRKLFPAKLKGQGALGKAVLSGSPASITDVETDPAYSADFRDGARQRGYRSLLAVPMLREGVSIGAIAVTRREPGPFTDHQIGLLKTFADQAVIAIENVRLFNETKDALERQTATAEILKVISGSPTDVKPVFDTILSNGARLCEANFAALYLYDGEMLTVPAHQGALPELAEAFKTLRLEPSKAGAIRLAALERRIVQVADITKEPGFKPAVLQLQSARTVLGIPLLREKTLVGVLAMWRTEVRPFTDKQIALLKTFADQAVIAIENVRLFNETKESLEQQTATARILGVMSSSPTDVQPVLDAVAESAARLCETDDAIIRRVDPDGLRRVAHFGPLPATPETEVHPVVAGSVGGRAVLERRAVHVADMEEELRHGRYPEARALQVSAGSYRSMLAMPLVREDTAIGVILIRRKEFRPFTDKQIALLKTFADQAVIAIENVRLFNETKEALEQQTATAEILRVISSSPSDMQPVFDSILEHAMRLCDAGLGTVGLYDGKTYRHRAQRGGSAEYMRRLFEEPFVPHADGTLGRMIAEGGPVHIPDYREIPAYRRREPRAVATVELGGARTYLAVPMLKDGQVLGGITIRRTEVRPFTQRQIDLLSTFASQAVIAIENVRLFKELQARTEALTKSVGQLTALSEVGQAISSSLDLETVLKTIVSRAVQLTGLDAGAVYEYDEGTEEFHLRAAENMSEEMVELLRRSPIRKGDGAVGGTAVTREPIQIPEIHDESYRSQFREVLIRTGRRALLAVPLTREDHLIGALAVQRNTPGPFAPEVVEVLKTFATQSAMAMQNARLFREIAEKGRQLEVASQHKSQFLASMSHELRTPLNALLGFNEMLLGDIYGEVPGDMRPPLAQMQSSGKHLLRLINNVLDLAKIEAGRMELALAEYSVHDTVESVRSTLQPLAAEKGLDFCAAVPADIPLAYGDPGRITQCLMNLAGNSLKFTKAGKVEISVAMNDGLLRYRVADTGIGIPPDKIEGLFTEFKQTDATVASEYGGTGLGLSISKKFVELHGGRIWAESEPGRGSVFTFEVPLRAREGTAAP